MAVTFYGLTFHLYGLIIGIAISVALLIIEAKAKKYHFPEKTFWKSVVVIVILGILGARFYHVFTDWTLYRENIWLVPQVWNGGLSIIGSFIGGIFGFFLVTKLDKQEEQKDFWFIADLVVFGVPIGQAIGRIANFVNQELYGLPTLLPWGIPIASEHRVSPYKEFQFFHPLFAYEALGMLFCAFVLWMIERKKIWKVGEGKYALLYLSWYCIFRAGLESLRVEKSYFMNTAIGFNQLLLVAVGLPAAIMLFRKLKLSKKVLYIPIVLLAVLTMSSCQSTAPMSPEQEQVRQSTKTLKDHQKVEMTISRQADPSPLKIKIEVVNSSRSHEQGLSDRDEIGSDGMLFIFPQKGVHRFWMKDMKFDIDMIWILDGEVRGITSNVKHPELGKNTASQLEVYKPPQEINQVLEVPAGEAGRWKLQVGDKLSFE
jgi:phosphatidylglycerol---prolipoprotein diacylglyceryl transferase